MSRINRQAIEELRLLLRTYPLGASLADYAASGYSARRWAFDHLWIVPYAARVHWVNRQYAAGCNDDHIFTALKAAIKENEKCPA